MKYKYKYLGHIKHSSNAFLLSVTALLIILHHFYSLSQETKVMPFKYKEYKLHKI